MKKMMKATIATLLLSTPLSLKATSLPVNKEEYCSRHDDPTALLDYAQDSTNLIAFKNRGGLFNGGVCWWHSRFQRNALYLAILRPDLPRPQKSHIPALIKELRWGKSVVTIPGFAHFYDFTETYKEEIIKELEAWQIYDGVLMARWIDGLRGQSTIAPSRLKKMLDDLYHYVEDKKKIAYMKLQIKGITAHAWLVTRARPINGGYDLTIIDSNDPKSGLVYSYKAGDDSFYTKRYGHFVPYLEFKREELALQNVSLDFCKKRPLTFSSPLDLRRDIEEALQEK